MGSGQYPPAPSARTLGPGERPAEEREGKSGGQRGKKFITSHNAGKYPFRPLFLSHLFLPTQLLPVRRRRRRRASSSSTIFLLPITQSLLPLQSLHSPLCPAFPGLRFDLSRGAQLVRPATRLAACQPADPPQTPFVRFASSRSASSCLDPGSLYSPPPPFFSHPPSGIVVLVHDPAYEAPAKVSLRQPASAQFFLRRNCLPRRRRSSTATADTTTRSASHPLWPASVDLASKPALTRQKTSATNHSALVGLVDAAEASFIAT